ncbi:pyrophosphatase PpaX [Alteribacillus persepolensis]|uniref:Pyrophosphatase PpaX n=1 Tax=Alteribacillus persepolensis TaxID=568899 RepID=A0A1G8AIT6_9BACI|nr:pyrophosphatase PpaX [Alteribacillus persepolensis]SDH20746.1 pyrophosphatase PpaX [Alteribacillus persepolensis]
MTINTVLFDFDGTLVNTNELIIASYQHALEGYVPHPYSREDIISYIGLPLSDSFKQIAPEQAEELMKRYQKHNFAHHDELIEEYEGVLDTVKRLYEEGYKLGVVTTKRRQSTEKGLQASGLSRYFSSVVTFNDVEHVKPDPEPIVKAMNELQSQPQECVMVGDSQYDILAGKNAGVQTAGVAWTIKGEDYLASYEPDVMLKKMPDLLTYLGEQTR